ncbi:hypothetical protein HYH03_015957 [Edaphochlamys debaryana]|uniref:Uncharacterized protein n=1 Tax=Edaphochlamys debaryana TaxID=47281 RepID=A0A835XIF3_9CHLO|nr:hypothetical protein HYH03_015957 [Edaphochlamys debaryana]|eukprot:KAG2485282.1 hypothetical protein HYH03_015957 [Edaphochlamys debaryana]
MLQRSVTIRRPVGRCHTAPSGVPLAPARASCSHAPPPPPQRSLVARSAADSADGSSLAGPAVAELAEQHSPELPPLGSSSAWSGSFPTATIALRCKGGDTVNASVLTLVGAFGVLRDRLASSSGALPAELDLAEDAAEAWATALWLLEPKAHPGGTPLDWANLEPVLRLAHKYDSAVLRAMCATWLVCLQSQISLAAPLGSPNNLLVVVTLLEHCCPQPELAVYTQPILSNLDRILTMNQSRMGDRPALLAELKCLVTSPDYAALVSPIVQAKVVQALASSLDGVRQCPSCGCLHGFTDYYRSGSFQCAQCGK